VPNLLVGALSWHQRADARLVFAWMRYALNPRDLEAATTMLRNWPSVGTKTVSLWRSDASVHPGESLGAPLNRMTQEARQKGTREALVNLSRAIHEITGLIRQDSLEAVFHAVYARTGLEEAIKAQAVSADPSDALDVAAREEVRETLFDLACRQTTLWSDEGVRALLDEVATMASAEREQDAGEGRITISTIHASKGLEWHAVVVAGVAEGLLPFARSAAQSEDDDDVDGAGHLEDERRLYYVACTRAKRRLLLTYPMTLPIPGKPPVVVSPSRFLAESQPEPQAQPKPNRKWSRKT
jgi:superfamily I DNA/RNA helicase